MSCESEHPSSADELHTALTRAGVGAEPAPQLGEAVVRVPGVRDGDGGDVVVAYEPHGGDRDATLALVSELRGTAPVLVVSEQECPLSLLTGGAAGAVRAGEAAAHLRWAVGFAAAGETALSPYYAASVADRWLRPVRGEQARQRTLRLQALTCREREVLELAADGMPNRDVARRLHICDDTVKDHLRAVYRKMGVRNRLQAARCLWESRAATV
ncbi:helix-turn-helix transcriptional regulator [Streptomyces sp. XM4193]|uniref:helix-turn-helix transcriptional regulator n=1 Tax=Streptomyces sp. XM4193 TaxID=2929782 RepID=UPI001FF7822B|nr:helix-turn-helix transcriptional regulator [Streptomyces sp. XM4193]MCK1794826.1 helix-turn-helix transcriptional regulator [Streptomyces sp. XM4193]